VKKCIKYEVEGPRPRGRPKRTWKEVVQKDWQAHKLNREDALIVVDGGSRQRMIDHHDRCEWVNAASGTGSTGSPR